MDKQELFAKAMQIGALLGPGDMDTLYTQAMQYIPRHGVAIEVGSWTGGSASILGTVCKEKEARLVCVDAFGGDMFSFAPPNVQVLAKVIEHTNGLPVDYMVGDSKTINGYLGIHVADFIFVDGDHAMPRVMDDIQLYWQILKVGGVMLMHDYGNPCAVKECADKFFLSIDKKVVVLPDSIAGVIKI
jgi:predicted O-methyltransferase YrrM